MAGHSELFGSGQMRPHKRGVCNLRVWIRGVPLHIALSRAIILLHVMYTLHDVHVLSACMNT